MATQSVQKSKQGPVWPLGLIAVVTPGTPVGIMSLVDAALSNAPETATGTGLSDEYTVCCYEIIFTAAKAGAHGLVPNTGAVYIMMKGVQGAGNRDDYGSMIVALAQGAATVDFPKFKLTAAALNRNALSPYEFLIDADNASDGCLVTLNIE